MKKSLKNLGVVTKLSLFAVVCSFALGIVDSHAFCIYNNTDSVIIVDEVDGGSFLGSFNESIQPGDHKCCNWNTHSCNTEGGKDSILKFHVYGGGGSKLYPYYGTICNNFPIKAGGWITVEKDGDNYKCVAHSY